jgi:hypothetical protein
MRLSVAGIILLPVVFVWSIPCFAEDQPPEPAADLEQSVTTQTPEQTQPALVPERQQKQKPTHAAAGAVETPAPVFGRDRRENFSLGLDVFWRTNSKFREDIRTDTSDHEARTSLSIKPYMGIRLSDLFELRPALFYNLSTSTYDYTPKDTAVRYPYEILTKSNVSEARLGFDIGFFFYPIHGSFFRFAIGPTFGFDISLGPKTESTYEIGSWPRTIGAYDTTVTIKYDEYLDVNIPIKVPFSFDFVPSKHLGFRLTGEVISIVPNIHYVKEFGDDAPENRTTTTTTKMDLQKIISDLGIGFFILF